LASACDVVQDWYERQKTKKEELDELTKKRHDPNLAPKKQTKLDKDIDKFVRDQFGKFKILQDASPNKVLSQIPLAAGKDTALVIKLRMRSTLSQFKIANGFEDILDLKKIIEFSIAHKRKIRFVVQPHKSIETLPFLDEDLLPIFEKKEFDSPWIPYFPISYLVPPKIYKKYQLEFNNIQKFHEYVKKIIPKKYLKSQLKRYEDTYVLTEYTLNLDPSLMSQFHEKLSDEPENGLKLLKFYGRCVVNPEIVPVHYHVIEDLSRTNPVLKQTNILNYRHEIGRLLFERYFYKADSLDVAKLLFDSYYDAGFADAISKLCYAVQEKNLKQKIKSEEEMKTFLDHAIAKADELNLKSQYLRFSISGIIGAIGWNIPDDSIGLLKYLVGGSDLTYGLIGGKITKKIISLRQKPHIVSLMNLRSKVPQSTKDNLTIAEKIFRYFKG